VAYWVAQLLGAIIAAALVAALLQSSEMSGTDIVAKGTPAVGKGATPGQSIGIEAVLTFFLVFVVYGSAVDIRAPKIGGLAIGLTVALDILFGGPFTGAAMNPARTFGPAIIGHVWTHHYVYWIGPLLGGGLAGLVYGRFLIKPE
jgi:glycerol uptake facilitator-like aquaporin